MIRLVVTVAVIASMAPARAWACATCGCGDLTLTVMGSEKPFAGRLRSAVQVQQRTDTVGRVDFNEQSLSEQRVDAQLVWVPVDKLVLMLDVPALTREVRYVNLAEKDTTGLGDVELRGKFFIYQDDVFVPHHLLALTGGVKLPTAHLQRGPDGELLPIELQPGTGSVDPIGGFAYAYFDFPWSFYASATGILTTMGQNGYRSSRSLRTTTALQYQLIPEVALRAGVDTRTDSIALENGAPAADSGGFIGFATAETLFSFGMDWMLYGAVRVPVVNALLGRHVEGPFVSAGIAYDFF
jgi:hypothetical protein